MATQAKTQAPTTAPTTGEEAPAPSPAPTTAAFPRAAFLAALGKADSATALVRVINDHSRVGTVAERKALTGASILTGATVHVGNAIARLNLTSEADLTAVDAAWTSFGKGTVTTDPMADTLAQVHTLAAAVRLVLADATDGKAALAAWRAASKADADLSAWAEQGARVAGQARPGKAKATGGARNTVNAKRAMPEGVYHYEGRTFTVNAQGIGNIDGSSIDYTTPSPAGELAAGRSGVNGWREWRTAEGVRMADV